MQCECSGKEEWRPPGGATEPSWPPGGAAERVEAFRRGKRLEEASRRGKRGVEASRRGSGAAGPLPKYCSSHVNYLKVWIKAG